MVTPAALYFEKDEDLFSLYIWCIEKLGPTFIKMAQWASTRPDLFSPKLATKLQQLQDKTTTQPWASAEETLNKAFGKSWKEKLILDKTPIGSGCIAQVYKGILKEIGGDQKVAVKLIHPHVHEMIDQDMKILKSAVKILEWFPGMKYLSLSEVVDQFSKSMYEQMDLRKEAAHMERFRDLFKDDKTVDFAKPIKGFINENALVETLMEGKPISEYMKDNVEKPLKLKLSRLCADAMLQMVFIHNFIHGI